MVVVAKISPFTSGSIPNHFRVRAADRPLKFVWAHHSLQPWSDCGLGLGGSTSGKGAPEKSSGQAQNPKSTPKPPAGTEEEPRYPLRQTAARQASGGAAKPSNKSTGSSAAKKSGSGQSGQSGTPSRGTGR